VSNDLVRVDDAQALRSLDRFRDDMRHKLQRLALRKASKPLLAEMKSRVRRRSGALERALGVKIKLDKSVGDGYAIVGATKKVANVVRGVEKKRSQRYKAILLEAGTKNMRAKKFVEPSLKIHESKIPAIYLGEIERLASANF